MPKRGRPNLHKKYRYNSIKVSAVEDLLEDILESIPPRSVKAREIVKSKIGDFRLREIKKANKRK
jgi:hypothetical protein